jgi:hypothetical protein
MAQGEAIRQELAVYLHGKHDRTSDVAAQSRAVREPDSLGVRTEIVERMFVRFLRTLSGSQPARDHQPCHSPQTRQPHASPLR